MGVKYDILMIGTRKDSYEGDIKISRACNGASVLVRDSSSAIVIDTGAVGYAKNLLSSLDVLGLCPADIDAVVNTHCHQDHVFNNHLFSCPIYTSSSVWHPQDGNRVVMHPDITRVDIPCVRLINTPGHMLGHVSAEFESRGKTVVAAGDAIRESVIRDRKIPREYADADSYLKSMRKILSIADIIIPGHGRIIEGELLSELSTLALDCEVA